LRRNEETLHIVLNKTLQCIPVPLTSHQNTSNFFLKPNSPEKLVDVENSILSAHKWKSFESIQVDFTNFEVVEN
jgi:hypothetical protein